MQRLSNAAMNNCSTQSVQAAEEERISSNFVADATRLSEPLVDWPNILCQADADGATPRCRRAPAHPADTLVAMTDQPTDPALVPPAAPAPPDAAAPSFARATMVMTLGTGFSRLTGFVRLAVIAWAIGGTESRLPDTYNLANSMPNIIYQLVLGEILATLFVPVFVEYITTREREESWRLASTILNIGIVLATAFAVVALLAAPWIIKIYTFRIDDVALRAQQEEVGTFFLRLLLPQMIFYTAGAVLTGLLNAHRRFAAPAFAPLLNNLIVILTFVVFRFRIGSTTPSLTDLTTADKLLLAGGTTLGVIAMTMVLWPFVLKLPGRYQAHAFDWRHEAIRHVGGLAKFSLGYVVVNQIGLWVVYMLANAEQGGVSAYNSAWILYQFPYGIFAVSVMTALVPSLSEHHVRGDRRAFRGDLSLGLRVTAFIILPAAVGFVALGRPIIRLLLERGVFGAASTELFADTFILMALGLASYATFQQLMRAFYAMQDARTPWVVNIIAVATTIATALPAFRVMGVPGLGLAHAVTYTVGTIAGGAILRRRLGGIDGARLASSGIRILLASVLTGLGVWLVAGAMEDLVGTEHLGVQIVQVGTAVVAGLVLYAVTSRALRVDEFRSVTDLLARRFRRRRTT